MDLREIKTEDLVKEICTRFNVSSSLVKEEESIKVIISGPQGRQERYLRSVGPGIVIQVSKIKF